MSDADEKSLVKYDNDFVLSTNFNRLSKIQQDIFFTGISFLVENKSTHVVLDARSIKRRAGLTNFGYTTKQYFDILHGLEDVILSTQFLVRSNGKEWRGVLFNTFAVDETTGDFEMFLNPHAAKYFFNIPGAFSLYELTVFLQLHSRFEQILFREFLAHYPNFWKLSYEDIINVFNLNLPDNNLKRTKQRVANFLNRLRSTYLPHVEETGYFRNITVDIHRKHTRGNPIDFITFSYERNEDKGRALQNPITHYSTRRRVYIKKKHSTPNFNTDGFGEVKVKLKESVELVPKLCPLCKAPLLQSFSKDNNKPYYYCENNKTWGLGLKSCEYFHWKSNEDKDDVLK